MTHFGSEIRSTRRLVTGDVTTASGVPAVGEYSLSAAGRPLLRI